MISNIKNLYELFKEKDQDIIVQCNLKITYLNITLDLNDGTVLTENPAKKPTIFTSIQSTRHRHQSLKKFHAQLKKRLSILSSSKNIFQESAICYEKCLKNGGYKTKIKYREPRENNQNKKKRKRNIIWFNPPYIKTVKTNIRRIFVKLISKHFPPNHKFVKIFNKNTIKRSYSCVPNIRSKIKGHNKQILQPKPTEPKKLCNCLVKEDCPMNGLCLTSSILYQATIKSSDSEYGQKRCKGICETTFKKLYANHKKSFNFVKSKNDTTLSIEYWTLKQKQQARRLTWEIKGQYKAYNPTLKKCNLC